MGKNNLTSKIASLVALVLLIGLAPLPVKAIVTTPATINYQGRLLNASSVPLAGSYTFRFSLWTSADWVGGDTTGGGAINTGAATYAGWNEVHTVTTGTYGLFDVQLGSTTALPNFTAATHAYLQVEVKPSASADTAYEILDPSGDLTNTTDRKTIDKQAYAENADTIDNTELSTIQSGTPSNTFTLDTDNTGGNVTLQFGGTLAESLTWNNALTQFELSDDLYIGGGLEATGAINFSSASAFRIRENSNPNTSAACGTVNELIMNTTTSQLMRCTATGIAGVATWTNVDTGATTFSGLATRVKELVFTAEYPNYTLASDGADNKGKMITSFEDNGGTDKHNFFEWLTQQGTMQDMDIVVSTQLPLDFVSFTGTPIQLVYRTSNGVAATNKVDVSLYDTTGTAVGLTGASALASAAWTTASITFSGSPTFTAGDTIVFHLKLSSTSAGFADVGDLILNYDGR